MRTLARLHGRFFRVLLDGEDVSSRCTIADDKEGWVCLLKQNEAGKPYYNPQLDEVAKEVRYGVVTLVKQPYVAHITRTRWFTLRLLDHIGLAVNWSSRLADKRACKWSGYFLSATCRYIYDLKRGLMIR